MSWIGLRDHQRGYFNEAGLGATSAKPADLNAILPKGSLMMSFGIDAERARRATTLLQQVSNGDWISGLKISLTQDGSVEFAQAQGQTKCHAKLPAGLSSRVQDILLTYTWDAPARTGMLSLHNSETNETHFTSVEGPMPLSLRDAIKLTRQPGGCALSDACDFLAVADHIAPHGPLPALLGNTLVPTPKGYVLAETIKPGDLVVTEDGTTAQVRWAGSITVPNRARFAKVTARAPFMGATRDLTVAAHQRIEMAGTEVDYLFASNRVSVRVGDLPMHVTKPCRQTQLTQTYYQVLLDRQTPFNAGGLLVEPLNISVLIENPKLHKHSVLCGLPSELTPSDQGRKLPQLRPMETLTLCQLMAA